MTDTVPWREMANSIAGPSLRTRGGIGAYRKHRDILRDTVQLALESGNFAAPTPASCLAVHPRLFHFYWEELGILPWDQFFADWLVSPTVFRPQCLWALYWGLAKAELAFATRYVPMWSHDERLTGHLVSQVIERMEEFQPHWLELDRASGAPESTLNIWYADVAAGRLEKETGADLGLILHASYRGQSEFFKVVRVQAKKVGTSGSARIDVAQARVLTARDNLGYYVFYHGPDKDGWQLPPTVQSSAAVWNRIPSEIKEQKNMQPARVRGSDGVASVGVRERGWDFAAFLAFSVSDLGATVGVPANTPEDAVTTLMRGVGLPPPSRVVVITLGTPTAPVDWMHIVFRGDNVRPSYDD